MLEWFEKIADEFCEEQAVEERTSVETIKNKFYTDLNEKFLCSLPTLLFNFLIEKGLGCIVKPRPSLHIPPLNPNWAEKKEVGKIHCRKGVGILPKKVDRTIQDF